MKKGLKKQQLVLLTIRHGREYVYTSKHSADSLCTFTDTFLNKHTLITEDTTDDIPQLRKIWPQLQESFTPNGYKGILGSGKSKTLNRKK